MAAHARLLFLALVIFAAFTWRAPLMFFSGDDMMNMYKAWQTRGSDLVNALWAFWTPAFRPLGGVIYHAFYAAFGFHPAPLYALCWALLLTNVALLYLLVARISNTAFHPLVACVIATVHGAYLDLYYSAGTIYDRLSALFILIALNLWASVRLSGRRAGILFSIAIALLTIAACDGKENAVALPVLLLAAELLLVQDRKRALLPVAVSAAIAGVFVATRVYGTAELSGNAAYHPALSGSIFAADLGAYLGKLTYGSLSSPAAAITVLAIMFGITLAVRSRLMIFGLVWFLAAILPVAFIEARLGYVLYLPMMGFGIWASDLLYRGLLRLRAAPKFMPAYAMVVVCAICVWHIAHWPRNWVPEETPEWITTKQFLKRYPKMPRGSKLLFVTDPFPRRAFDLLHNLRLLYHDDTLTADREYSGFEDQRPRMPRSAYDHVFVFQTLTGHRAYIEYAAEWVLPETVP